MPGRSRGHLLTVAHTEISIWNREYMTDTIHSSADVLSEWTAPKNKDKQKKLKMAQVLIWLFIVAKVLVIHV